MTQDLMWYRQLNEERPPDWRWQRAVMLEDRQAAISKFEDKLVNQIRGFLKASRGGMQPDELCAKFPIFFEVSRIHNSSSNSRWLLEALVMANVSPEGIAARFGWSDRNGTNVVEVYENTKFDVRSRLKFDSYIQSNIIVFGPDANLQSEERIWKALAYICFKNKLETKLLDYYISFDSLPSEVKNWYDNLIDAQLTKKTLRSLLRFDPMKSPLINDLLGSYQDSKRFKMEEKIRGLANSGTDAIKMHETLIKSLQVTTASIQRVVHSGIEPRALIDVDQNAESVISKQIEATAVKRVENTSPTLPSSD